MPALEPYPASSVGDPGEGSLQAPCMLGSHPSEHTAGAAHIAGVDGERLHAGRKVVKAIVRGHIEPRAEQRPHQPCKMPTQSPLRQSTLVAQITAGMRDDFWLLRGF
jgi:hypothetical protein